MFFGLVPWFLLMIAGLVASVLLLLWGHRSGQFAEQERARYLPFRDEEVSVVGNGPGRVGPEAYALVCLVACAGIALVVAFGLAMLRQYSG